MHQTSKERIREWTEACIGIAIIAAAVAIGTVFLKHPIIVSALLLSIAAILTCGFVLYHQAQSCPRFGGPAPVVAAFESDDLLKFRSNHSQRLGGRGGDGRKMLKIERIAVVHPYVGVNDNAVVRRDQGVESTS